MRLPKALWIIFAVIALGGAGVAGLFFLRQARFSHSLAALEVAVADGNIAAAVLRLRELAPKASSNPRVAALRSHVLALLGSPMAASSWKETVRLDPENAEYRVASVLASLAAEDLQSARATLAAWPDHLRGGPAWDRASLAVAFASGNWTLAHEHALRLARNEPGSAAARLNLAKVRLMLGGEEQEQARADLRGLLGGEETDTAIEAGRVLLREAVRRSDRADVRELCGVMMNRTPRQPAAWLAAFEALARVGEPLRPEVIRQGWALCRNSPPALGQLAGWMAANGWGGLLWELAEAGSGDDLWAFPAGFNLAGAAGTEERRKLAVSKLEAAVWPAFDEMRLFALARLRWGSPRAANDLRQAVAAASRVPGGLSNLMRAAMNWRWDPGLLAVLEARVHQQKPDMDELAGYFSLLERRGDTEAMRRAALRHLELDPENPIALNNAAYFSFLRKTDQSSALLWARAAYERLPRSAETASTLALILIRMGDVRGASKVLEPHPPNGPAAWPLAEILVRENRSLPGTVIKALGNLPKNYPEERERIGFLLARAGKYGPAPAEPASQSP